ncbi:hypothetical protein ES702_01358 [subsurface metagenome]
MTFLKLEFTLYSLCYYANDKEREPGDCIAKINCYSGGQKVEKIGGVIVTPVFSIKFFKNDSEIPPNELEMHKRKDDIRKYGPVRKINLHYPISQFSDIISILRHEKKPLYFFIEEIEEEKDSPKGGLLAEGVVDDDIYRRSY